MKQLKIGFDFDGVIIFWLLFLKKDAKKVIKLLSEQGHTIKIVTARGNFLTLFQAKIMLKIYGLGWVDVVGVGRNGQKYDALEGFDFFLDNKVKHLIAIDGKVQKLCIFGKKDILGFKSLANWWQVYWEIQWLSGQN